MSALASVHLDRTELARLGVLQGTEALLPTRSILALGWPELERALPDRGLPRGVVEIAGLPRLSGAGAGTSRGGAAWKSSGTTAIAIAAMGSVHATDEHAWCAWITPISSRTREDGGAQRVPLLYAPALVQANVDLDRLLVVRPEAQALARTALKVAMSGAFDLVIVDAPHHQDLCGGAALCPSPSRSSGLHAVHGAGGGGRGAGRKDGGAVVVRKLALAAEECGTTTLLLTNALSPRSVPWPVALRIEVERRPDALSIRVTKDRRGCGSSQHVVRLAG